MGRLSWGKVIVSLLESLLRIDHLLIGDFLNANAPSCPIVAEQASRTASNCELNLQQEWPI